MITPKLQSSDKYTLNRSKVSQNDTYGKTQTISIELIIYWYLFFAYCVSELLRLYQLPVRTASR